MAKPTLSQRGQERISLISAIAYHEAQDWTPEQVRRAQRRALSIYRHEVESRHRFLERELEAIDVTMADLEEEET